jgi:L-lactate dehydrogenase complex protein LldG
LQKEKGFQDSSCITIISGPSRTADIEKVLVMGVHGPKNLYVILI